MRSSLAVALLLPGLASAADLEARSCIDSVTVYASSARVTRIVKVDLDAGDVRLVLPGLTDRLVDDSLRVQGTGTARARVHGVSVDRVAGIGAAAEEARAAQERLDRLQDQDRALEDQQKGATTRRDFVDSLRSTYSDERARNMAVRGVSSREWADMVAFVAKERDAAAADLRKAEIARRDLAKRILAAKADLAKLQAKRSETTKTIAVELRAEKPGAFDLQISYVVPNASWRPVWDARLAAEKQEMDLSLYGSVEQTTGEDWSDVRLAVSTAQPARSLYVPELSPRWLEKPRPRPMEYAARPATAPMAEEAARAKAPRKADAAAPESKQEAVEAPSAEISEGLLSATFTAPRRESVDGAGRARKIHLAEFPLAAELSRIAAPRQDPSAFLTAKATNGTGTALLPGQASVFVGDEFVGRAALPLTPPGGEVKLAFGADDRVKIERKVLERRNETSGLFTKDDVVVYRIRTTVKNLYATPVSVKVLDLVPVSREEDVKVKVLDDSTPPTEEDPMRPGVRAYAVSLQPREEKAIDLRYEVRFPKGMALSGLE
jgi:uncharacterized protein (TIGR02231 family)